MKRIAIIGGTGMLGAPVAKQLQQDGYAVRIITRNTAKALAQLGSNFEYTEADIFDTHALKKALKEVDAIHINLSGHSEKTYYQNHVLGTQNILAAVNGQSLDCISMISVATADPEYSERADNRYKLAAENLLKNSGQPYLIFRPSWFMETLPMFQQKQKLMHIGPSTKAIHWLAASDYASIVSRTITSAEAHNKTLTIYGPEPIKMSEAIQRYASHHQLSVQKMPVWLAKFLGRMIRDETLIDAADLLQHYDRTGEKTVPDATRTATTLTQWLAREVAL